jgi:amino acid transporter, AAT family
MPASLGEVNARGTPLNSLFVSSLGLGATVVFTALSPRDTYVWFFSVALFGGLFVWLMIFLTHIAYRRAHATSPRVPLGSCLGAAAIAGILIATRWVAGLETTLLAGGPWLLLLALGYLLSRGRLRAA